MMANARAFARAAIQAIHIRGCLDLAKRMLLKLCVFVKVLNKLGCGGLGGKGKAKKFERLTVKAHENVFLYVPLNK